MKTVRKKLALSQKEVCEILKKLTPPELISDDVLSRYENGVNKMDPELIERFGRHFNVRAEFLLYGEMPIFMDEKEPANNKELLMGLLKTIPSPPINPAELQVPTNINLDSMKSDILDCYLDLLSGMKENPKLEKAIFKYYLLEMNF